MFEEQSFDQSALKKLTEGLSQTKKVTRRKKVLAGKDLSIVFALARDLFQQIVEGFLDKLRVVFRKLLLL